mmetsp:Transcript_28626/g.38073  ORF Transcript_28626/g.38073 Transcript_28626/m.38073 type:complete len:100 (+) Transcript_28626:135-434(+)
MFSKSQIALLVVAAVASVEGFAPVAQPNTASNTQLEAFSNPFANLGNKGTATIGVAKKAAAPKKVLVKKAPTKAANTSFNNGFAAKKPEKKSKLTIYER